MKKQKVIPNKYMPKRYPVNTTVLYTFLMWHFMAPDWMWGVYLTITVIIWLIIIVNQHKQEEDESLINKPND